jgi:hypothetical protein
MTNSRSFPPTPPEAAVRNRSRVVAQIAVTLLLATFSGCRDGLPTPTGGVANPPLNAEASRASQKLNGELSRLINESNARFRALNYEYDEDLLAILDRADAHLSGKASGPLPRAMPKLDEQEELEHFRETIRRWKTKTGKDFRAEIDKLKAEVAARKPSDPPFHPAFHKHFSAAFDEFIPIEVAEIRERRNRYLHEKAAPVFDEYREKYPDIVREQEELLNKPPYNLTPAEPPAARKS